MCRSCRPSSHQRPRGERGPGPNVDGASSTLRRRLSTHPSRSHPVVVIRHVPLSVAARTSPSCIVYKARLCVARPPSFRSLASLSPPLCISPSLAHRSHSQPSALALGTPCNLTRSSPSPFSSSPSSVASTPRTTPPHSGTHRTVSTPAARRQPPPTAAARRSLHLPHVVRVVTRC